MRLRRLCFALAAMAAAITLTGCPGNDPAPRPASVTLTPATGTVGAGGTFPFFHEVLPAGVSQALVWNVTATPETTDVRTEPSGIPGVRNLVVGLSVPVGTVLTVRATADGHDRFGEATVTVTAVTPTSITLTPTSHIFTGLTGSLRFNHAVHPAGASDEVDWSFTPDPMDGVTLVDGLLTITADAPAITLTVTATAAGHEGVSAQATVNLAALAPESVTVSPADGATVVAGEDLQFTPTVLPARAPRVVTWEARNPDDENADGAISEDGVFNVPTDGNLGGLGIWTVRAVASPTVYSEWVEVEVTAPELTGISAVSPNPATITFLFEGVSQQFNAETLPRLALETITWSVYPDLEGVSIDPTDGYLTITANVTPATLTVTAAVAIFSSYATVTINPPTGGGFTIDFEEFRDMSPTIPIDGPPISLSGTGQYIAITNPAGDISWFLGGTPIKNTDFPGSLTGTHYGTLNFTEELRATIQPGGHFVTAIVGHGGMSYSRRIAITVTP